MWLKMHPILNNDALFGGTPPPDDLPRVQNVNVLHVRQDADERGQFVHRLEVVSCGNFLPKCSSFPQQGVKWRGMGQIRITLDPISFSVVTRSISRLMSNTSSSGDLNAGLSKQVLAFLARFQRASRSRQTGVAKSSN